MDALLHRLSPVGPALVAAAAPPAAANDGPWMPLALTLAGLLLAAGAAVVALMVARGRLLLDLVRMEDRAETLATPAVIHTDLVGVGAFHPPRARV